MVFASSFKAQETRDVKNYDQGFRLGISLNRGMPTNIDFYNYSLGVAVRLQYELSNRISLTLTTGFTN
ncbi:MAG: hypothetical protein ACI9HJ_001889 [Ulvibacter sp.]|jgi:hypothetical protein